MCICFLSVPELIYPELTPNVTLYEVERGDNASIICKAEGIPLIKNSVVVWTKESNGNFVPVLPGFVKLDEERISTTTLIDSATLMFTDFSKDQEHLYACRRIMPGDKMTQKEIRLVLKGNKIEIIRSRLKQG